MQINRTKNASRNITSGLLLQIYRMIVPFFMRTAVLYLLGVQYLGLNSLFTSILNVLNMAELGVGSAMVYSMYKPIAEDDTSKICALMRLYHRYYTIIGFVVLIGGLVVLPFLPNLISGSVPDDINIYVLYLMSLSNTVLSYWLFAYKNCLLTAHARSDVINKLTLVSSTVMYILQFVALVGTHNYYVYNAVSILTQVGLNIGTAAVVNKMYPSYKAIGELDKDTVKTINQRVKDLFTSKIGTIVTGSVDSVVISAFLGLTVLAVYQNYYYIMSSIISVMAIIFSSCTAAIGNSLVTSSLEKNYDDFNTLTFIIFWLIGICIPCFLNLYQPFMRVWVGEDLMLDYGIVILLCIYFLSYEMTKLFSLYKDSAGLWHQDRFRPLVVAIVNLVVNIILVQFIGLYGIILSTVLSEIVIGTPWLLNNLFSSLFGKEKLKGFLAKVTKYLIVIFFSSCVTFVLCNLGNWSDWVTIILNLVISLVVSNAIYFICYHKSKEFDHCVIVVDRITGGKLKLTRLFRVCE